MVENIEDWQSIKGYEGFYEVSNYGRVRSVDRTIKYSDGRELSYKGMVLKPNASEGRYLGVSLYKNQKKERLYVHRLVAKAFIENSDNKPQVNHKDGNRFNNYTTNLEWVDQNENMKHAYDNGLSVNPRLPGEMNPNSKLTHNQVNEIRGQRNKSSYALAVEYGVNASTIQRIWNGKSWSKQRPNKLVFQRPFGGGVI